MRAYEEFLRKAGTPIGVVGSIGLGIWLLVQGMAAMFATPPNEDAWTAECQQIAVGNSVLVETPKMGGQHFCVQLIPMEEFRILETSTTGWKAECITLGGIYRVWNSTYTCYRNEIAEELGAQEDFQSSP